MGRASDDTREHAVALLRHGLVDGRLGTETFVARVDAAYHAKTHDELRGITGDLPRRRQLWSSLLGRLRGHGPGAATAAPLRLQPPELAVGDGRVIGRDPTSDYAVADPTVSSRHAELVRLEDGWLIRDLDSRNGTRVNGWLVSEQRLRGGERVTLGAAAFTFWPPGDA